ncbi:MAG: cache domain-containing protein, partial [Campylobacterota bacterium]|nr:cache domain-containing protein [Campylobacterota bacterium]
MLMKTKQIISLVLLFVVMNSTVYFLTKINTERKINLVLDDNLNILQTHYNILMESQKHISYAISKSILRNTDAIKLLENSYNKNKDIQHKNRTELNTQLIEQYKTAKKQGILQIQFVFPDNVSFLRVHKPSKFGDDLTNVREDYKIVSQTHKPIRGFTQGRIAHGFRNTFPIFNKEDKYIGAMEISFSSDRIQWYLNHISHIHSHFLVNKNIFDSKTWERDDLVLKYEQSAELDNYMLNIGGIHTKEICIIENKLKLAPKKEEIDNKMQIGKSFALYVEHQGHIDVETFLPIKNLSNETVAWIVGYDENKIIENALLSQMIARVVSFVVSIVVIFLIAKQLILNRHITSEKDKFRNQHQLLNEILNTTENIMIITDLKDIKLSNDKFKSMVNIGHCSEFNKKTNNHMMDLFIESDGYLHHNLPKENETFVDLIKRTKITDRKVLILNEQFVLKAYSIAIQKLKNNGDYLITLSDISKLQEELVKVEEKAYIDGLTQVYNRNKFDELFE